MKNFLKTISLFCLLVILATCKKDKATEEQVLTQHEQKIINKIDGFMPKEVELMFNNNFASHHGEKDYAIYLDSIETAIDELKNVVQVNFSLSDYEKAMNNSLINLQNSKGYVDCLGLGYSKGVSVDVIASGIVGSVIVIGLQASGGGGVKTIYDFVNLERQIYYYSLCGYGLSFGAGIAAALKAGLGFSGINEVITGIRYHGSSSGINNFEGQGVGRSFSLSQGIGVGIFSIGASVGIGTSNGAVADLNGINNLLPCPDNMVEIENGTKSYSFKVSGSGSVMVGFADLSIVLALNTTGTNSVGVKSSYTKFSSNKVLAGLMMAKELCLNGPMDGIIAVPGATDLAASTIAIIYSFKDFSKCPAEIPAIGTKKISSLSSTSAVGGGIIINNRGDNVSVRGVVWSKLENPTIDNNSGMTTDGQGIGEFTSNIINLTANSTYYVRAYATNNAGTAYGIQESLMTPINITIPTITTTAVTAITSTSSIVGGNITNNGGSAIITRGVCWSTSANPTTALTTKTSDGTGTGVFTSSLTGLTANTTYYVRAYATNSIGTAYGSQISFTTTSVTPVLPSLTTSAANSITSTAAASGGNITSDGGASVTARGICWSTTSNPTTALSTKTSAGTGTGSFTSNITGLTANTTYYVRAYATNSIGTAYGTQVSFTTSSSGQTGTVTDIEGNIYNTVTIGTQTWIVENLKTTKYNDGTAIPNVTDGTAWAALTTPSYCWYNNDGTTYKATYGALYNWYTVNSTSNGGKNVCPTSWHVPSHAEWTTLTTFLGGEDVAGGKLKETGTTHWATPNAGATNETGFTALPGSLRDNIGTFMSYFGSYGSWWTSTEFNTGTGVDAVARSMYYNGINVTLNGGNMGYGMSIRCLKDN